MENKKENIIQTKSFDFALKIIELYKFLKQNNEYVISKQLLKSGTSIGANVQEAGAAQTKKDFITKMSIASKEARETKYWLNLLNKSNLVQNNYNEFMSAVDELINILTAIVKTSQKNI
ncbi:MAG: four helix bundle protein [Ignavibacteria bacterium GWB2_35_12]|nr:MAG: four helix bundle protein [Ignavibacteria bacterium GWA2_35_8]OGU39687.1 MAG: four helix bundle protein [Ignavibacteria bacterium GWB2_35_12]OGU96449.1 MAG: four helix bundle protein [Ignavibacteria bacterium RIFOXYA2_FULL_35_10]OGV23882.1 MAG: four helix bundle protein [Ignavibacteria bacterium RIFOXYC2_FULL_35_21]